MSLCTDRQRLKSLQAFTNSLTDLPWEDASTATTIIPCGHYGFREFCKALEGTFNHIYYITALKSQLRTRTELVREGKSNEMNKYDQFGCRRRLLEEEKYH